MNKKTLYVVKHTHKYGCCYGYFKSDKNPEWIDNHIDKICDALLFDFEPDNVLENGLNETVEIRNTDDLTCDLEEELAKNE